MNHKVEILEYRQLSNGQAAVLGRCCGNDVHRSWHTMGTPVITDNTKFQQSLNEFYSRMASEHQTAQDAEVVLKKLVGTSNVVNFPVPVEPVAQAAAA